MNKVISPAASRGRRTTIIVSATIFAIVTFLLFLTVEDWKYVMISMLCMSIISVIMVIFIPDTYRIIWKGDLLEISSSETKINVHLSEIESVNERFSYQAGTGNEIKYFDIAFTEETEFGRVISFKLKVRSTFISTGSVRKIGELRYSIYSLRKKLRDQNNEIH